MNDYLSQHKSYRVLDIFDRLKNNESLTKKSLAQEYRVSEKTIQRDIEEVRQYIFDKKERYGDVSINYSRAKEIYEIKDDISKNLNEKEILAVSKIILGSRAFNNSELKLLYDKLIAQLPKILQKNAKSILDNEVYHYVQPQHGKKLLDLIYDLSVVIRDSKVIKFNYTRMDGKKTKKEMLPVAIMFSEYYFYLIAFDKKDEEKIPIIFRIDRMSEIKYTDESFYIPYRDKFEDGEFRKRIQFMYTGKLKKVKFKFSGKSLESILDRLPTAKVLKSENGIHIIEAESYGNGINMWLNSQGEDVEILEEREV
ncbi:helix-turn-helix transcriptional regulator [Gemella sp. oral taxon 928]|uniref:helix-turn-helix transcriptional regulator n=1 Tax=Gemella sp. oral taxon 928 TaxID=1785995 RepID=UPI000AE04EC3|nr:WYL domain-containing protein [Gemella sp. oral taxon 928]